MDSVSILATWRGVMAPLAGDRSLRGLATTKRLRADQRDALHARLSVREYRRGEIVYRPGGPARHLYVVLAGVARLAIPAPNGRSVLIHLLPAGEVFGHTALVEGGAPHIFEAAAYTDLRVGRVGSDDFFEAMVGTRAQEVRALVSLLTERWISLVQRLARFLAQDLQARVAASLIEVARAADHAGHDRRPVGWQRPQGERRATPVRARGTPAQGPRPHRPARRRRARSARARRLIHLRRSLARPTGVR